MELAVTVVKKGGHHSFTAFIRDVSERKKGEENSRLLVETSHNLELLSTLSHELRTPLTAIVGWAYLLRMGGLDEATARRALDTIERNAKAQAQKISDILDVCKIATGKLRLNLRAMDLPVTIVAAVDAAMPAANAKGIRAADGARPHRRARVGGSRPPAAGGLEPPLQRGQVHAARRHGPRAAGPPRFPRRHHGRGHGHGDPRRLPSPRLRAVPAGRRDQHPRPRRAWGWAWPSCATSWRCTAAASPSQPGHGQGRRLHRDPAPGRRRRARGRGRASPGAGRASPRPRTPSPTPRGSTACACSSACATRTTARPWPAS